MGISNAVVELRNPRRRDLETVVIEAIADMGSIHLVPMEDMDLVIHPKTQRVIPNPANPGPGGSFALLPLQPTQS